MNPEAVHLFFDDYGIFIAASAVWIFLIIVAESLRRIPRRADQ